MAAAGAGSAEHLQRPLYVFSLPATILNSISRRETSSTASDVAFGSESHSHARVHRFDSISDSKTVATQEQQESTSTAASCNLCDLQFSNVQEQRGHVRSDLHRYNLKQREKGLPAVDEPTFERLIGDLNDSLSGSESSETTSDDEQRQSSPLANLLRRQAKISPVEDSNVTRTAGSPFLWFASSALAPNVSLGVYRALFAPEDYDHAVDIIKRKQFLPAPASAKSSSLIATPGDTPSYFLCMVGGGHFAAMVVSLSPRLVVTHKGANERHAVVLAHKTFHRYTTRRKQGGSQSANDNAKGAAHSAGAGIRRANEAALQQEIRSLLSEWKALIDACELVFIRATGSENRRTLFGPYEGQVLKANDHRNRGFPFTTRRATQSELMRAFQELTRVKVSHYEETAKNANETVKETIPTLQSTPKQKITKPDPADQAIIHHSAQIGALIKRSRVPGLVSYFQTHDLDARTFVFKQAGYYSPLHMASAFGAAQVVSALLLRTQVDPLVRNEQDKTAYEVAKDRATRDAFRAARFTLGETACNWEATGIGAPLDPASLAARAQKEAEAEQEEAKQESLRRKVETERLRQEAASQEEKESEKRMGKGRALGQTTAADQRELEGRGMTPEMRMRLERERRARAAEARLKR